MMLAALCAGVLAAPAAETQVQVADTLEALWKARSQPAEWRSAGVLERRRFQQAMVQVFVAARRCPADTERLRLLFSGTPFDLTTDASQSVLLVAEKKGMEHGGGLYAIRCGEEAQPLVLQAPHSFFDLKTRQIAAGLFGRGHARAAFFNTVHRYRSHKDENVSDLVHPADLAHQHGTFFHAATVAALAADARIRVVQLHGFAKSRPLPFEVIVSSGDRGSPSARWSKSLAPLGRIAIYGQDTRVLGGRTNVQGKTINRHRPGHFLHLEFSHACREQLLKAPAQQSLMAALEGWQ